MKDLWDSEIQAILEVNIGRRVRASGVAFGGTDLAVLEGPLRKDDRGYNIPWQRGSIGFVGVRGQSRQYLGDYEATVMQLVAARDGANIATFEINN